MAAKLTDQEIRNYSVAIREAYDAATETCVTASNADFEAAVLKTVRIALAPFFVGGNVRKRTDVAEHVMGMLRRDDWI